MGYTKEEYEEFMRGRAKSINIPEESELQVKMDEYFKAHPEELVGAKILGGGPFESVEEVNNFFKNGYR